jgi:hypothetical protein
MSKRCPDCEMPKRICKELGGCQVDKTPVAAVAEVACNLCGETGAHDKECDTWWGNRRVWTGRVR